MFWVTKVREKRQDQKCPGSWHPVSPYLRMRRSYVRAPVAWVGCLFTCVCLCCDDVLTQQARTKHDEPKQVRDSRLQNPDEGKERGDEDASRRLLFLGSNRNYREGNWIIFHQFIKDPLILPPNFVFVPFLYKLFNLKHHSTVFMSKLNSPPINGLKWICLNSTYICFMDVWRENLEGSPFTSQPLSAEAKKFDFAGIKSSAIPSCPCLWQYRLKAVHWRLSCVSNVIALKGSNFAVWKKNYETFFVRDVMSKKVSQTPSDFFSPSTISFDVKSPKATY